MAQVLSNGFLDFRELNFTSLGSLPRFGFFDNFNPSLDSGEIPGLTGTYSATDLIGFWAGANSFSNATTKVAIGGNNFVLNAQDNPLSGTATGLTLTETVQTNGGGTATNYFAFVGFSVSLVAVFNASLTASMTDDRAVLRQMLSGADRIVGSNFADYAYGGNGNDKLFGNAGNDTLSGDAGNDQIRGGTGNDLLKGGSGADLLVGDGGNDRLDGGLGADTLTGGAGADRFIFVEGQISTGDRVTDFQNDLDTLIFDAAGTGSVSALMAAATNISGGVRFNLDGDILTVMGVTKAQLVDDILII